jgi:hypothetical protein
MAQGRNVCVCLRSLSCEDGTNVRDVVQLQPRGPPSGVSVRVLRARAILHAHSMATCQPPPPPESRVYLLLQLLVVRLVRVALYPLLHAHAQSTLTSRHSLRYHPLRSANRGNIHRATLTLFAPASAAATLAAAPAKPRSATSAASPPTSIAPGPLLPPRLHLQV